MTRVCYDFNIKIKPDNCWHRTGHDDRRYAIVLYDVMDYLNAEYPPKLIREKLVLNDEQIGSALAYIETHQAEVEAEYQECLQTAAEIRQFWEDKNRERFAKIATMPPKPGQEVLRAKLQTWKDRLEAQ